MFNLSITPLKKDVLAFFSGLIVWISGVIAAGLSDFMRAEYIDLISFITVSFILLFKPLNSLYTRGNNYLFYKISIGSTVKSSTKVSLVENAFSKAGVISSVFVTLRAFIL